MKCAEDYVRYCCQFLLDRCLPDLQFMESMIDKTCIERLKHVASQPFARCSYTEAIEILQKAAAEGKQFVEKVSGASVVSTHLIELASHSGSSLLKC